MTNIQQKIENKSKGINDQLKEIDGRLEVAEKNIANLHNGILKGFQDADKKISEHDEILTALIELVGLEAVGNKMKENKINRLEAESAQRKTALEESINKGQCKVAETVSAVSIIVGSETDKDGTTLYPLRAQLLFAQLKKEYAELLIGKKAGDVIDTPNGGKFTINEIYDMVLPKPEAKSEPQPVAVFDPADSPAPPVEDLATAVNPPVATDGSVN